MANDWNKDGYFSGITEDYSNYRWYKGESKNPYMNDRDRPLAASFWQYERGFHLAYLDSRDASKSLSDAYNEWKSVFLGDHLPGKAQNPNDTTNWVMVFKTGRKGYQAPL